MNQEIDEENLTIADLYPELTEAEQAEAEENLKRYLQVIWRIFERNQNLTEKN